MTAEASQERRVRRTLSRHGFRLQKTPSRHWSKAWYGSGYSVIDDTNTVVFGCYRRMWEATLSDVVSYAADLKANPQAS